MTLTEPRPYKNILKEGVYKAKREENYITTLFTFTSVVQILDYVDKNHMNTHECFRCSDLSKLIKIIIIK